MIAASFAEDDPLQLIEIGLSEIPRHCRLAEAVKQAVAWFKDCQTPEEFMNRLDERYASLHPAHTIKPRVFGFQETSIRELAERQLRVFERTREFLQAARPAAPTTSGPVGTS